MSSQNTHSNHGKPSWNLYTCTKTNKIFTNTRTETDSFQKSHTNHKTPSLNIQPENSRNPVAIFPGFQFRSSFTPLFRPSSLNSNVMEHALWKSNCFQDRSVDRHCVREVIIVVEFTRDVDGSLLLVLRKSSVNCKPWLDSEGAF